MCEEKPGMKKNFPVFAVLIISMLSGCSRSFVGTLFLFSFRDIVAYVSFALVLSIIVAVLSDENWRTAFWISFILSLLLTPIAGLIYCLILLTRR